MGKTDRSFLSELERRVQSRCGFASFRAGVASSVVLTRFTGTRIAASALHGAKPTLVWRQSRDGAGPRRSFLRVGWPTVAEIILDAISGDDREAARAATGPPAEPAHDAIDGWDLAAFARSVSRKAP